ncbi:hypothetical protein FM038_003335 [Shewanella eurypsychrophilus]|uniref:Phage protein n=1 Tax=Shewanella eurypsychrophilus TaxID=2593656 RepID=A0ABX6V413_9GAMM|nr:MULTISPECIES: hypothetical protein [Shewanella]QFU21272.1 hypothetical protein FS418_04915 [Shewanella sp. YLB-09]QPG56563.1 hypothetical protein FM038_003335 [Shewanella eurypsychrophilus]
MHNDSNIALPFEEDYQEFEIYVETNPDSYNEGFSWSISKNHECLDSGLEFDIQMAIDAAHKAVTALANK